MSRVDWTVAILRVFAISLLAGPISALPSLLPTALLIAPDQPHPFSALGYLEMSAIGFLTTLLVAMVLWRKSSQIAHRIWLDRPREESAVQSAITPSDLQEALLTVLGVWLLVSATIDLTAALSGVSLDLIRFPPYQQSAAALLGVLVEIIAGLILTFGHGPLVAIIRRVRTAGLRPAA